MELKQLEELLGSESVETRIDAVRSLAGLDFFYEDLFVEMLGDVDWRVRKEVISLYLGLPDAVSRTAHVVEQLRHPDNAGLRNAAIEILITLGVQGTPELIRQLSVSDAEVRKFIVDILGEIGHSGCVDALLPFLHDADENVRYAVVETLGKLRADESVNALLDLLEAADAGLRFTIFDALATIGAAVPVTRILPYASDRLLRKTVFSCLGKLGNLQALPVLFEGLSDPMRKVRETALLALGQLIQGAGAVEFDKELFSPSVAELALMADYLEHDHIEIRRATCYLLSLQFSKELLLRVLPLLADEELRSDVVAACKHVPVSLLEEVLEEVTLADPAAIFLIYISGELGCCAVAPLALQAMAAEDPQLRYAAAMTLGKIGSVEAIDLLGEALTDEIPDIREAASEALCLLGAKGAIPVIKAISSSFESEQADQRLLAVRTLGGLDLTDAEDYLLQAIKDAAPAVRCEALRSLKGGSSRRLLTGLSLALTDENADVRRLAASALQDVPASKSLAVLEHVLDDRDPWVRTTAIRSLQGGQPKEVIPLLERGLADPVGVVVIAALETIACVSPDGAQRHLLSGLENEDLDVVKVAVSLLLGTGANELLLAHASQQVRMAAVAELQLQDVSEWQQVFEQRLSIETDPVVRQLIEEALRRGSSGV